MSPELALWLVPLLLTVLGIFWRRDQSDTKASIADTKASIAALAASDIAQGKDITKLQTEMPNILSRMRDQHVDLKLMQQHLNDLSRFAQSNGFKVRGTRWIDPPDWDADATPTPTVREKKEGQR